ncbi:MAG: hypothetical protein AAF938_25865, partial [Myxococcota bacterium]
MKRMFILSSCILALSCGQGGASLDEGALDQTFSELRARMNVVLRTEDASFEVAPVDVAGVSFTVGNQTFDGIGSECESLVANSMAACASLSDLLVDANGTVVEFPDQPPASTANNCAEVACLVQWRTCVANVL